MAELPSTLYFVIMLISPYKVQPDLYARRFFTSAQPAKKFVHEGNHRIIIDRRTFDVDYPFEKAIVSESGEDLTRYDFVAPRLHHVNQQCVVERLDDSHRATGVSVHVVNELIFDRWTRYYMPDVTVLACYDSKETAYKVTAALTDKYPQNPQDRRSEHGGLVENFIDKTSTHDVALAGFDVAEVEMMIAEWGERDERKKPHIWFLVRKSKGALLEAPRRPALPRPAFPMPALPSSALTGPALPRPALPRPALPRPALPRPAPPGPAPAKTGAVGVRGASLGDVPKNLNLNGPLIDLDTLEYSKFAPRTATASRGAQSQRNWAARGPGSAAAAPYQKLPAAPVPVDMWGTWIGANSGNKAFMDAFFAPVDQMHPDA